MLTIRWFSAVRKGSRVVGDIRGYGMLYRVNRHPDIRRGRLVLCDCTPHVFRLANGKRVPSVAGFKPEKVMPKGRYSYRMRPEVRRKSWKPRLD